MGCIIQFEDHGDYIQTTGKISGNMAEILAFYQAVIGDTLNHIYEAGVQGADPQHGYTCEEIGVYTATEVVRRAVDDFVEEHNEDFARAMQIRREAEGEV